MKTFVINQSVRFDPRSRTLIPLEKPENKIQLHTPVSECLLLLLTHNGKTLSQSYLSEEVWIKKGSYVTPNSLYQNIAAIRRALKAAGLNQEMLKTVPKAGFQIYASLQEEEELLPAQEEVNVDAVLKASEESSESEDPKEVSDDSTADKVNASASSIRVKAFYVVLTITFTIGLVYFYHQLVPTKDVYASYNHIGMINKCDVYSSYSSKEESIQMFNTLMKRGELSCYADGKAYLTFNLDHHLSSVILCDQPIENKSVYCKSYIYVGNKNEN